MNLTKLKLWFFENIWTQPVRFHHYVEETSYSMNALRKRVEVEKDGLLTYLIERTNHRDQLFRDIEAAVLGRDYHEALKLAREGWQLRGR